jgi:hypothetical protein
MPKIFQKTIQPDVDLDATYVDDTNHFTKGVDPAGGLARGSQLRWCEDAVFAHQYDEDKWYVPGLREPTS